MSTSDEEAAAAADVRGFYRRHAVRFDAERGRALVERPYLEAALALVPGSTEHPIEVLDLGCGMGEPIASFFVEAGHRVTGVDVAEPMIARCRERFPAMRWLVGDMRSIALDTRFDLVIAWDSYFHLPLEDARAMFPAFARLAAEGSALLFTSGPGRDAGYATGELWGDALFHASLGEVETRERLAENGYRVVDYCPEDPECGGHTVWLAQWPSGFGAGVAG